MAVIYGWTYAEFHARVGWDKGAEAVYNEWENHWARRINSYIFDSADTLFTDANEILEIQTLVNKLMVLTNLFLKGESNETPLQSGFYANPGFPDFDGEPTANQGIGSGDYIMLNKYKNKYGDEQMRVDRIRMSVDPAEYPPGRYIL
jgi:hypothetical protein